MAAAVVAAARVLKRKAPRGFLRNLIKRRKPQLHLKSGIDLWVHLNCLLFLHRLAEETRMQAFQNKSRIIKDKHIIAAAKVILKKSRG
ncbi:centromere protein W isoform X1 [Phascolarctos cinereus]|uniref:Centromere protein W isoform X1 n=1 Tax=Phascolarctos cinereus TaxID=38626 RepID=A0A6P5KBG6_PHACI|nr:centromere protein W isoform X1 [Phascolarctos cinereus]